MPLILSVGLVESGKYFGGESADDAHVGPTTTATATITTATVSITVSMIITSHGHYHSDHLAIDRFTSLSYASDRSLCQQPM
ncbi:hypothetical protein [Leptolyngbya sp. CCY15150]|uniref:hypothetical protein n=1 Tax=Leptolyngbya sp. CCY15150 TaxID=2767772 RepID=UPI00195299CA|nr:hypothetical protein [Leptolyngbya sp. CCY15150]